MTIPSASAENSTGSVVVVGPEASMTRKGRRAALLSMVGAHLEGLRTVFDAGQWPTSAPSGSKVGLCRLLLKALPLVSHAGGHNEDTLINSNNPDDASGEVGWRCAKAAMALIEEHVASSQPRSSTPEIVDMSGGACSCRQPLEDASRRLTVYAALGLAVDLIVAAGKPLLKDEQVERLAENLARAGEWTPAKVLAGTDPARQAIVVQAAANVGKQKAVKKLLSSFGGDAGDLSRRQSKSQCNTRRWQSGTLRAAVDGSLEFVKPLVQAVWVGTMSTAEACLTTLKQLHVEAADSDVKLKSPNNSINTSVEGGGCESQCSSSCFADSLVIGCDTEWSSHHAPALVQLATAGHCWLVDTQLTVASEAVQGTIAAEDQPTTGFAAAVDALLTWLLNTRKIRLLGFAFKSDIDKLGHLLSRPVPSKREDGTQVVVDIQSCAMDKAEWGGRGQMPSLKRVVETWLPGKTLNKAEQCSEWGQRPLTPSQLEYAAIDAEVLVTLDAAMHSTRSHPCESK
eukprot:SAG31_NODE_939_length_10873_cov_5.403843_4_plen_513_part_00